MIPIFSVALAEKLNDKIAEKLDFEDGWLSSRKFDGVRTLIYFDAAGNISFYSREGNEFATLGVVERKLKPLRFKNVILDTEACIVNTDGSEDFKRVVSEIKKKSGEIKNPKLYVFDMITTEEFNTGYGERTYQERRDELVKKLGKKGEPFVYITEQTRIKDAEHLDAMKQEASEKGWEGLIIRKEFAPYQGKRSKDMLKIKELYNSHLLFRQ